MKHVSDNNLAVATVIKIETGVLDLAAGMAIGTSDGSNSAQFVLSRPDQNRKVACWIAGYLSVLIN
jgi:hypothetical protein